MSEDDFTDYYELLQLSPNADTETIERVFRYLAKKFHPDNRESGDTDRFRLVVEAHRALSDPEKRAGYDVKYQGYWNSRWKLAAEAGNGDFGSEWEVRESLLSLLYFQRRNDMKKPGLGNLELARLLCKPPELVEFNIWYLKAKGWVERLESGGQLAITALGVDHVEQGRLRLRKDRLLTAGGVEGATGRATHLGPADVLEFPRDPDVKH